LGLHFAFQIRPLLLRFNERPRAASGATWTRPHRNDGKRCTVGIDCQQGDGFFGSRPRSRTHFQEVEKSKTCFGLV